MPVIMDDDMEDEIIYEIFSTHVLLFWRYFCVASDRLTDTVAENFNRKLFNSGPFMLFILLIVALSLLLQSKGSFFTQYICSNIRFSNVKVPLSRTESTNSFKNFVSSSITYNAYQEYKEGIVGIYAMQGRRGNMEDRFCVMQDIGVGDDRTMSFFGVYDGHGGQFVAEYVKDNLFQNTIEKIRQLRAEMRNDKDVINNNKTKEKSQIENESKHSDLPENKSDIDDDLSDSDEDSVVFEVASENSVSDSANRRSSGIDSDDLEVSLKSFDVYCSTNLKKKNSFKQKETPQKKVEEEPSYIDSYKNINYTKLLTDQIMDIDQKVVEQCKNKIDMSGTTAIVALLDGELLVIGNVGDSRAVMGDTKGCAIPLSVDHKPNQLKERKRIKEAGGFITYTGVWRVAGILATSRALGDFPLKDPRKLITAKPDVLTFSLRDHKAHFVILATDGLWDVIYNEEAVAFVRSHIQESDYGARSLALHAYSKGSLDNITVAVINLSKISV